jgi:hypothetical protein
VRNSSELESIASALKQLESQGSVSPPAPTPPPPAPPGGNTLHPILTTMTDPMSQVWVKECQSLVTTTYDIGNAPPTVVCAGDIQTISGPSSKPFASVTVGLNQGIFFSLFLSEREHC